MKRIKKQATVTIDKVIVPEVEPLQQEYLVDNIVNAMTKVLKSTTKKAIVVQAPTGSGKSFTITNYTAIEITKKFKNVKKCFLCGTFTRMC